MTDPDPTAPPTPAAADPAPAAAPASADDSARAANGHGANGHDSGLPVFKAGTEDLYVEAKGTFQEKDVAGYVPSPESEHLRVRVARHYEGPLDLLLHLIDKHALDIFDIPIKVVVAEYMKVLDEMRDLNLDIAGEFLVMAAQLAHIKSKLLLPKEERPKEPVPEIDPRADLVRRLLEYQRFKEAAYALDQLPQLLRDVFPPAAAALRTPLFDGEVQLPVEDVRQALNLARVDPFDLIRLFDQILQRQQKLVVHEVMVERISVGARINDIVDAMTQALADAPPRAEPPRFTFAELVDRFGPRNKRSIIVSFLSILEMTRLKLLRIAQDDDGRIVIVPVVENLRADDDVKQALTTVDEFGEPGQDESDTTSAEEAQQ